MQVNVTAVMAAVVVVGLGTLLISRGRWSAPIWLVVAGCVAAYPFSRMVLERMEDAPDTWFGMLFRLSCGWLLATLLAPLYHRLRKRRAKGAVAQQESRTVDAPRFPT
ncbi:hypothetical protein [Streptomyces sp. NPDC096105]|uniref:hypothetical protein n=1 Tax=Streptomyces sp. NPDC096105 TaxID=3366074 RepID=UPI0037F379BE